MLAPAGIPVNFSVVFAGATPANVAFSVYEESSLLLSPVQMDNVVGNVYTCSFTPEAGKLYTVFMAVYISAAFSSLDGAFTQQCQAVTAMYLNQPINSVVGVVSCEVHQ